MPLHHAIIFLWMPVRPYQTFIDMNWWCLVFGAWIMVLQIWGHTACSLDRLTPPEDRLVGSQAQWRYGEGPMRLQKNFTADRLTIDVF